jgi:hypothetical protein
MRFGGLNLEASAGDALRLQKFGHISVMLNVPLLRF